jgi:16S rRNA (uracil1498-N3)-methyltransferase
MSTTFFYHSQAALDESVEFDSSEATHITKALRLKSGDRIELTNGRGALFLAELAIEKHRVSAGVVQDLESYDSYIPLHLGISPTKNADRIEWLVEKAVELGVGEISLIQCAHSERSRNSIERINRVAIAALKQSRRTYLPRINEMVEFHDWLKQVNSELRLIAHCMDHLPRTLLRDSFQLHSMEGISSLGIQNPDHISSSPTRSTVCIAIGPEGDFSESEVLAAQNVDFLSVSLGSARLRTETAALAAIHTYNLLNQ